MDGTTVKSGMTGQQVTLSDLLPVGCTPGTEGGSLEAGMGEPLSISGYLGASYFYDHFDQLSGARDLDFGVTTAVAIQSMSFDEAAAIEDGNGPRIDLKSWTTPLSPETGAGSVDLDELDGEAESKWFILGLVPTSESILNGMQSLAEWHQAVRIQGYLVSKTEGTNPTGYLKSYHKANNECAFTVGQSNREDAYVLVTGISLVGASVSQNGDASDEWVQGNVPGIGRGGFIIAFFIVGLGGAVGLFVVSRQMVLGSATKTMKTLIGSAGLEKAASVKTDAKAAKKAGMESPTERQARLDKEYQKEKKGEQPIQQSKPSGNAMGGFDLDSVLASTSNQQGFGGSGASGRKSSVVVTDAAQQMDRNNAVSSQHSSLPPSVGASRSPAPVQSSMSPAPVQSSRSPPTTVQSSRTPAQANSPSSHAPQQHANESVSTEPIVRRRRAVQQDDSIEEDAPKQAPQAPARQQYAESEEDFSDFSL